MPAGASMLFQHIFFFMPHGKVFCLFCFVHVFCLFCFVLYEFGLYPQLWTWANFLITLCMSTWERNQWYILLRRKSWHHVFSNHALTLKVTEEFVLHRSILSSFHFVGFIHVHCEVSVLQPPLQSPGVWPASTQAGIRWHASHHDDKGGSYTDCS